MTRSNPNTSHIYAGIAAREGIKAKAEIRSYADCQAFLHGHNTFEDQRSIASNVRVVHWSGVNADSIGGEYYEVILYETPIIRYYSDGTFSADNGGHNTPTTSARCNQFGPRRYHFSHEKKKLIAWDHNTRNALQTGHDKRYPV